MRQILIAWVFGVAFQASYLNVFAATTVRTVALSGQHAPGTLAGEAFQFFLQSPAINNAGQTAFRASVVTRVGAWSEGSGALSLVARVGDPVSSLPTGIVYSSVGFPLIGEDGSTVLLGGITGPGINSTNDFGILSDRTGSLQFVAREGDQAPDYPAGTVFSAVINEPLLNSDGSTAFPASPGGYWTDTTGTLALTYSAGVVRPAAETGFNAAGQLSLIGSAGPCRASCDAIWLVDSATTSTVASQGQQAPGLEIGMRFGGIFSQTLNSRGDVVFHAVANSLGGSANYGIWLFKEGELNLVVRAGNAAPGLPPGVGFESIAAPELNRQGQILFKASLMGAGIDSTNNQSLWIRDQHEQFQLLAREGEQAPGLPTGTLFSSFDSIGGSFPPADRTINGLGQTAFFANFRNPISGAQGAGIWAQDSAGNLHPIVWTGQQLEVAPGDVRTVSFVSFSGNGNNEEGHRSGFNDRGQLAFWAQFPGGGASGIFVSNLVAIPEPGTLALVGIPALVMLLRRR
jgi:hypothetical protein